MAWHLLWTAFLVSPLLLLAWARLRGALRLASRAEKHTPFSRLDGDLPLRGRWLRYAAGAFVGALGMVALVLAALAWWALQPRF